MIYIRGKAKQKSPLNSWSGYLSHVFMKKSSSLTVEEILPELEAPCVVTSIIMEHENKEQWCKSE